MKSWKRKVYFKENKLASCVVQMLCHTAENSKFYFSNIVKLTWHLSSYCINILTKRICLNTV